MMRATRLLLALALALVSSLASAGTTTFQITTGTGTTFFALTNGSGNLVSAVGVCDGTAAAQCVAVKAASTAAVAADPALVVALSPNNGLPTGANVIGSLSANQSVNAAQVGGTNAASTGVAGSLAVGGPTASGVAIAANPLTIGCRAQNAEPTAVTNAQVVNAGCGLEGKIIVLPFANKENNPCAATVGACSSAAVTAATNTTIIAAQAAGIKIYLTGGSCLNTGTTTSEIDFTSGLAGTTIFSTINPAGSGTNFVLNPAPATAAATALAFTTGSASSSQKCSVTAYIGT